jgi:Flp pilus assembly pilin Flp
MIAAVVSIVIVAAVGNLGQAVLALFNSIKF